MGYLVVRRLNTADEYETWMPSLAFDELYEEVEPLAREAVLFKEMATGLRALHACSLGSVADRPVRDSLQSCEPSEPSELIAGSRDLSLISP